MRCTAFCDGAYRPSSKLAACGCVLWIEGEPQPVERTKYLGKGHTNNTAEYEGVLMALRTAKVLGVKHIQIVVDSRLVAEQLLGSWQIKDQRLQMLAIEAQGLAGEFEQAEILHVRREKNKHADRIVTALLDEKSGKRRQGWRIK